MALPAQRRLSGFPVGKPQAQDTPVHCLSELPAHDHIVLALKRAGGGGGGWINLQNNTALLNVRSLDRTVSSPAAVRLLSKLPSGPHSRSGEGGGGYKFCGLCLLSHSHTSFLAGTPLNRRTAQPTVSLGQEERRR